MNLQIRTRIPRNEYGMKVLLGAISLMLKLDQKKEEKDRGFIPFASKSPTKGKENVSWHLLSILKTEESTKLYNDTKQRTK